MSVKRLETLEQLNTEISSSDQVLIKFEAEWCSPCKAMASILEDISRNVPTVSFVSVDIESEGMFEAVKRYGVRSVPSFVKVNKGSLVALKSGTLSKLELSSFVRGDS
jgi:thioredoxin 1